MASNLELAREILESIETADEDERYRGLRDQLYGFGSEVLELLRAELSHPSFRRRMAAATNLGRLGDTESTPQLVALLSDPQAPVREMALFALGILGDATSTEAILTSLNDYDANVRYRAVVALGDLSYPQMEEVLIRAMADESYGVREQALSQLRADASPAAVVVVLRALLEREYEMQHMAEETLDRLVPKMTREHYKALQEQLTLRERRLILNYLDARNLQEVYSTLWQRLQLVNKAAQEKQKGLDKYGRLLNAPSERVTLTRAFERDDVVNLLVEHFMDEDARRSILLVGEAGTGKSAIIQEFARRILDVDETWHILETNTSELMSGTRYLGDWETKLKEMTEAILKYDKVIVYVTNPNDLLGAGAHSKSDENFADFFKPYLQRGQLRLIAECTEESLKGGLGREPGFLRLFRQVKVQEMTDAQTLTVLESRLDELTVGERRLEAEPGCLLQVVDFARSFYTRSTAPGRACDLMDALIDFTARKNTEAGTALILKAENIPECLSETTGISLDLLDDTVPLDLEGTRKWFGQRLIDQDPALQVVVDRLAMIKAGLGSHERPLGVFFLVGPTGVGKTYFTKLVAERLFGDPKRMLRFDLSEYKGRFAVEKLIGSPYDKDREGLLTEAVRNQPFSVLLFDEFEKADAEIFPLFLQIMDEGRLTDARGTTTDFRQTIIFMTSNLGASRTSVSAVGFSGSAEKQKSFEGHILKKLDEFFAPEFLNRIDEIIPFEPLSTGAMERLVNLELEKALERRGFLRRHLHVHTDRAARKWLEEHGFSQRYGARELKRTIERTILTPISRLLVGEPGPHDHKRIAVTAKGGKIEVAFGAAEKPPAIPREPKSSPRPDKSQI